MQILNFASKGTISYAGLVRGYNLYILKLKSFGYFSLEIIYTQYAHVMFFAYLKDLDTEKFR